jgi:hypothetical protein
MVWTARSFLIPIRRNVGLRGSTFNPLTWAFGGGEGIRTHGLYIANVQVAAFSPPGPSHTGQFGGARLRQRRPRLEQGFQAGESGRPAVGRDRTRGSPVRGSLTTSPTSSCTKS